MTEYVHADLTRLTWAEVWRMSSSMRRFTAVAIVRLTGTRIPPTSGHATDGPRFIDREMAPVEGTQKLDPAVDRALTLGFRPCAWTVVDTIGPVNGLGAHLLHGGGTMYAAVVWSRAGIGTGRREQVVFGVVSRLSDGRFLSTTDAKQQLNSPAEFEVVRLPGQSVEAVVRKHQERLAAIPAECLVRFDDALVRETVREAASRMQGYNIERGALKSLTAEDVARILQQTPATNA